MSLINKIGQAAAACQAIGLSTFLGISRIAGCLLFLLSGIFWTLETLLKALEKPGESSSMGFFAGTSTTVNGAIALTALFTFNGPLSWVVAGLGIITGFFWYQSARPSPGKPITTAQNINKLAATLQTVSICLYLTSVLLDMTLASTPALAFTAFVALSITSAFMSACAWFMSYHAPEPFTEKPSRTQTTEKRKQTQPISIPKKTDLTVDKCKLNSWTLGRSTASDATVSSSDFTLTKHFTV